MKPVGLAMRIKMSGVAKVVTTTEAARVLGLFETALKKLRLIGNGPVYVSRTFSRKNGAGGS